jgi:outer membrane receptor protein involved in Fe transport
MFELTPLAKRLSLIFTLAVPLHVLAAESEVELAQMVVTATKTQQSIRDVPAAVSVVSREQIEQSSATTVDQLLQGIPGVYAARMEASSPNRIAQTYSRGLPGNSRTLVLLDGIPMNVLYDGQVDWSQLSTQDVERVEIVRGASSGLYGANAMGGVINILSRAPEPGINSRVSADYGSLNSKRLSASHSQSRGATAFSVSASRYESDGYTMWRPDTTVPAAYRDAIGTIKSNVTAKLLHEIDSSQLVEAGISYLNDESTGFYKPGAAGYTPQTREQYVPTLRYSRSGAESSTSVVVYGRFGKQWADTLNPATYASISEKGVYNDQTFGLNAQHTQQLTASQKLTVGLDYVDGGIDNHFNYPGTTRLRDTKDDLTRYGAFLQDEIEITKRWRANLAGRFDHWKTGGNQTDTGTGQPNSTYATRQDSGFSPKFGTLYQLAEDINLRATAGKAFNLPDMFNLYANTRRGTTNYWANPDLLPEKVKSYDLGLDYYFGKHGHLKATVYRNDATDFIYSVQRNATNVDKINVGGVVTKGLELEALYRLLDKLSLTASYTHNDSVIVKNDRAPNLVGKQLTNVPKQQAYLRIDWTLPGAGQGFAVANYVGNRFGDDANTVIYKKFTTYDVGGSYPISRDVTARLTFANVTNKKYDGIGYIAPGTLITGGISAKF